MYTYEYIPYKIINWHSPGCLGADTFNIYYHNLWVAYWIKYSKITNLQRRLSDNGHKNLELLIHVWLGFPERYKIFSSTQSTGTTLCSSSSLAIVRRWRGFSETKKGFSRCKRIRLITTKIKPLRKLYTPSETPPPPLGRKKRSICIRECIEA